MKHTVLTFFILIIGYCTIAQVQTEEIKDIEFQFRALGPYRTGSWISEIAVPQSDDPKYDYTYYVASRNGGIWKTTNRGTSFFPVSDSIESPSIGAIAIAPSNPEIIWAGTGEDFNARLSHPGKGIFKSENGGKSWQYKGLGDSHHISVIIVHPGKPDIIYAAVMGHLFSPNTERGVFKSNDGGNTWEKILYVDENTGVTDLVMDPVNPDVLYAASYEKYRYPWHFEAGGEQSAIYKTTDGGQSWNKLIEGLPEEKLGRIGLAVFPGNTNILYAVIEKIKPYIPDGTEADQDMHMKPVGEVIWGDVYRSDDGGSNWEKTNPDTVNVADKAPYSFNKIYVDPIDPDRIYILSMTMPYSEDGGKTWDGIEWGKSKIMNNVFGDFRTMWIDPKDGRHMLIGSDGGLYESFDRGITATHLYQLPLGEVYNVSADMENPYNIYCGLQDHEVWRGPSNSWKGEISLEDWFLVGKWDGMYCPVDTSTNRYLYTTTQFGAHQRVDQKISQKADIEPVAGKGNPRYRFPWDPPLIISPHNSSILYTGGQMLLQSLDRGEHWIELSDDLTTNDPVKIAGKGHMMYCTITTISESPRKAGLIWVGTDDGRVHVTTNSGQTWIEATSGITATGIPSDRWTTRVTASAFHDSTAYVCKSGFKFDDFSPYIAKTTDLGRTWELINKGLPDYPVNVIIEDPVNPDLLFAGTDEGVYFSLDAGFHWLKMKGNMPVVPVKDLTIQPREKDLIIGTYGRGMYLTNINWLEQFTEEVAKKKIHFFTILSKPVRNLSDAAFWGNNRLMGDNHLFTANEPNGLTFEYWLHKELTEKPEFFIYNDRGLPMDTISGTNNQGLNKARWHTWDQKPGSYKVVLKAGKKETEQFTILKPAIVYPVLNWRD